MNDWKKALKDKNLAAGQSPKIEKVNAVQLMLNALSRISPPPAFAKALTVQHQKMREFLRKFNIDNVAMLDRLIAREDEVMDVVDEMRTGFPQASDRTKQPIVLIPSGLWDEILYGSEVDRPEAGEHWPKPMADGPITWGD